MAADPPTHLRLTDTQLRILAALCRPVSEGNHFATPATNQEIAEAVFLSVDAVKGHLRTLYRKFGIEDLPHNQKRARLVELAVAGGYVDAPPGEVAIAQGISDEDDDAPSPAELAAAEDLRVRPVPEPGMRPPSGAPAEEVGRRSLVPWISVGVLVLVIIGASLATSGIFNQGSNAQKAPTPAAYRTEVDGYCKLALAGAPAPAGAGQAARARGYLEVIETMRGRLESLVPPTVPSIALERFQSGLTTAANYTSDVAKAPPASGSAAEAKNVAELTFAAGQVQAGALGYELGHQCLAIGNLIASSAQNAVAP
jgi:hypothetical protein